MLRAQTDAVKTSERMKVDEYDAETRRMAVIAKADPDALKPVIREMISQMIGEAIGPLMDAHAVADRVRNPPPVQAGVAIGQPDTAGTRGDFE